MSITIRRSGIINDMKLALTRATLLEPADAGRPRPRSDDRMAPRSSSCCGARRMRRASRATARSQTFCRANPTTTRRRAYLKLVSDVLIEDLHYLVESWDPKNRNVYAGALPVAEPARGAGPDHERRRAFGRPGTCDHATGWRAGFRSARRVDLAVQRDQLSRPRVLRYNGFQNVWTGDQGGETRPGLGLLIGGSIPPWRRRSATHSITPSNPSPRCARRWIAKPFPPLRIRRPVRTRNGRSPTLKRLASLVRDAGLKLGVQVFLPN